MPAKLVQIRRGTTSNHSIFVGETGEITVDTDKDTVVVHDKATAGGHPLAKEDMTNVSNAVGITQLKVDQAPSAGQVLSVDNTNSLIFSTIDVSAEPVGGDLTGTVANAQINANTIGITELNLNDGNDGQFLKTNGAGVISFGTVPIPDISAEPVGGDVTGTVGNIQIPDNSITSAMIAPGVIVAQDIATNAVNGTHLAMGGDAAGDTLYYNGTDYIRLAKGTAGQVLTMNGGATAPEWAASTGGGGGGNSTYIEDVFTGDGTTTTFTLSISASSEEKLLVFIEGVAQPTGTYTLPTPTTIDITSAPPATGDSIRVLHMGVNTSIIEDNFIGDGTATTFSPLTNEANDKEAILVFIDGVAQPTGSYTLPTTTSIDFPSSPPGNGSKVKVLHLVITNGIGSLLEDTTPQLGGALDFNGHKFTNHILPSQHQQYDIGSAEFKIRHLFLSDNSLYMGDNGASIKADGSTIVVQDFKTGDLHLDNTHRDGNSVDGTSGSWTFEEGDENLFLLNNITGKKYKINLTEIE